MGDNIGQVFNVVESSGNKFLSICACLAAISLLNWFILFFGLIYLFRSVSASSNKSGNLVSENEKKMTEKTDQK